MFGDSWQGDEKEVEQEEEEEEREVRGEYDVIHDGAFLISESQSE